MILLARRAMKINIYFFVLIIIIKKKKGNKKNKLSIIVFWVMCHVQFFRGRRRLSNRIFERWWRCGWYAAGKRKIGSSYQTNENPIWRQPMAQDYRSTKSPRGRVTFISSHFIGNIHLYMYRYIYLHIYTYTFIHLWK